MFDKKTTFELLFVFMIYYEYNSGHKKKSALAASSSGGRLGRREKSVSIVEPVSVEESISEPSQEDYDVQITRQAAGRTANILLTSMLF